MKARITVLIIAAALCQFAVAASDAERWYVEDYARLWEGKPAENIDQLVSHYADQVITHEEDGEISVTPRRAWLEAPMAEWLAEGWLDSKLKQVVTDQLNSSTVSFKALWVDRYNGAPDDVSCGWYLADRVNGKWQITTYADIDCKAHGLQ